MKIYNAGRIGSQVTCGIEITEAARNSSNQIGQGARIGKYSRLLRGLWVGEQAFVLSGSTVKGDIPNHALVGGVPARLLGFLCPCAMPLILDSRNREALYHRCPKCGYQVTINSSDSRKRSCVLHPNAGSGGLLLAPELVKLWDDEKYL